MKKVLVANRGEIAVRIIRTLADLGIQSVAVYAEDDVQSSHVTLADEAVALQGVGVSAYLDKTALLAIAQRLNVDAIHPGYGFLSERADFAQDVQDAGMVFIGPTPHQLAVLGDKAKAISLAKECDIATMPSTSGDVSLDELYDFFDQQKGNGIVIKAVGGGGGRGMRIVTQREDLAASYERCQAEAKSAFGLAALYGERLVIRARHIEVQIVGDGFDVVALGERDCTLQRRFQKLIEIAPSPALEDQWRQVVITAALRMAQKMQYKGLGTFEFLIEEDSLGRQMGAVFIETNPRLQVEHTITEEVTGLDLVAIQLGIAQGKKLLEVGLNPKQPPVITGIALQARVNAEHTDSSGMAHPVQGVLSAFDAPSGLGVRVDTHAYHGYRPSPHYDALLAKLIVSSPYADFGMVVRRFERALSEFYISGLETNLSLLRAVVMRSDFQKQDIHTRYWAEHLSALLEQKEQLDKEQEQRYAHRVNTSNQTEPVVSASEIALGTGQIALRAVTHGVVIELHAKENDILEPSQVVAVIESMKMQYVVLAEQRGKVVRTTVQLGDVVPLGQILFVMQLEDAEQQVNEHQEQESLDPQAVRADLDKVLTRHAYLWDENRPQAVARRRARQQRTARENVADLVDEGSFVEYGALVVAAQASRRSTQDLIENTPADGLITGVGTINAELVGQEAAQSAVMAYDATVLAGTQGKRNHVKTDRIVETALRQELPFVLFAEGGGGRPGDIDVPSISGLHQPSFAAFAELSGVVPVVGIVSGRCFAGNAAFLGCCDVIISDQSANIGMAGPAMIEGGGLGVFRPEDIGPAAVQYQNGVVDILVDDEFQAVKAAKHYLSIFQGPVNDWQAPDAYALRRVVPENRLRAYDSLAAVYAIADVGSVLVLRGGFGLGIHTALARIEGKPVGIMASNPAYLGGAIDADAGDKAARFMQLCDAHGLPIISLIDTPGFMVGPDIEAKAQVRHVSRMFLVAAKLRVPLMAITLRKGYGLGAMAMAGGGFRSAVFTIAWPTGEFGPMGLEGAIQLGFKKELEAVADGPARRALYDQLVAQMYERGHALSVASYGEIDAVIDPIETRQWICSGMGTVMKHKQSPRKHFVDAW